ncbi:MAG: ATP-dependent DNA helicase [Nitrososphaerales archaeon]
MDFCTKCGTRIKPMIDKRYGPPSYCTKCGASLAAKVTPRAQGLAGSFPFESMRRSQKEVLDQVEAALAAKKKFIILEAPVGFGKSAIAASLCLYLESAYLLTSTKQLQDQYLADFEFRVVTGKSNFTCLVPTSSEKYLSCGKGRCEADWKLSECPHYLTFEQFDEHRRKLCDRDAKCERLKSGKLCPYYQQKWDAFEAPIMVANYPFLLTELHHTKDVKRRKLLVCDEAHDLEKQMVSSTTFSLSRSVIESYETGKGGSNGPSPILVDRGIEDASSWKANLLAAKQVLESFIDTYLHAPGMQERVAACNNTLESLNDFLDDLSAHPSNWIVNSVSRRLTLDGRQGGSVVEEVVFKPLQVGAYTSGLFESADIVLFMSATIFSKEVFCRTLGIAENDTYFIRVRESTFPVENRRIHMLNTARLSKATMEISLEAIAQAVDKIMTHHAGERGVVHTTSYQQTRYIMGHVTETNKARLTTTEGASSRSALLRRHGSTDESVLISPSLYEGVDLKDDLSRFQVLVKVPYPDLSERRTRIKLERDPGWYDWQTALRLVQTYGRSIRSETDYAATYVLDSNFPSFLARHRDLFPEYFIEALG